LDKSAKISSREKSRSPSSAKLNSREISNFVGQKGDAMTSFAGGAIKKDVCYCCFVISFSTAIN